MKQTRLLFTVALAPLLFSACTSDWRDHRVKGPPGQAILGPDWYGDSAEKLVWLDQGWSRDDSNWFYTTTQGSQLLPYPFFLALEQPDNTGMLRDARNMQKYRYLPQTRSNPNPDALPIGFVADAGSSLPRDLVRDQRSLGLTCAACHTTQINYNQVAMRIDGGPAMADFESFMTDLSTALQATAKDDARFGRFAARILGDKAGEGQKTRLRAEVRRVAAEREAYNRVNSTGAHYGFARLDAFGRIFNNALTLVDKRNGVKANASVSYPHLWGAPHEDFVQWTGIAPNAGIGPITRNVGEVVGVFATIHPGNPPPSVGYATSVRLGNLIALENRLKQLQSPQWPESILGRINPGLKTEGRKVFAENCASCHRTVDRTASGTLVTVSTPISELKTDPLTAANIMNGRGRTGFLEGTWEYVIAGNRIPATAPAFGIVGNTVLRTLAGQVRSFTRISERDRLVRLSGDLLDKTIDAKAIMNRAGDGPKMQYKARPLNGIWATAPYLHNGSVPNLRELLLPPEQRSKTFYVGVRAFDPANVGFQTQKVDGAFLFDTSVAGNSNSGHVYGTTLNDNDRAALLEYLKSI